MFDGARFDGRSADGRRQLESVPFRGCASSTLGRHQRPRRKFGQADVGSKLSEATDPTGSGYVNSSGSNSFYSLTR